MANDLTGPRAPQITTRDIWTQFKIDISGKEVQTAETYSHSWVANQFGHVCLGLLFSGILGLMLARGLPWLLQVLGLPASWTLPFPVDQLVASLAVAVGAVGWEWHAYSKAVKDSIGPFPPDRELLRKNAITAAAYIVIGALVAFAFRYFAFVPVDWLFGNSPALWGTLFFVAFVAVGILVAIPWLRQKIVWQKAGLPYLFRLADARAVAAEDASSLLKLIENLPPPERGPQQIVVGGPIGSGRTEISAGIGTEFAFRDVTVRYVSFAELLEFAARSEAESYFDDSGPPNIAYWHWARAQVIIIDDIGPLLTANRQSHYEQFAQILDSQLRTIKPVLEKCHTVWVVGDPQGDGQRVTAEEVIDRFARHIGGFCGSRDGHHQGVMVVQLEGGGATQNPKAPRPRVRYLPDTVSAPIEVSVSIAETMKV